MATPDNAERQGLSQALRSQMGYGTATLSAAAKKTPPRTRKFISRKVLVSDTLMGIALKYGVTVQELKRENKMWSNDHLFLVENLLIPLTSANENLLDENDTVVVFNGNSYTTTSSAASSSKPPTSWPNGDVFTVESETTADVHSESSSKHKNGPKGGCSNNTTDVSASTSSKTRSFSTPNPNDFFSKYDRNIARLKGDVAKMEKNATNLDGIIDANPLSLPPRKGSGSSRRDSNSSTSSTNEWRGRFVAEEDGSSPVLVIRSRTNNRHVKSTIENLEQVNDDIFEL